MPLSLLDYFKKNAALLREFNSSKAKTAQKAF